MNNFWQGKRVVITGAAFIGIHLAEKLIDLGARVKIFNLTDKHRLLAPPKAEFRTMDLRYLDRAKNAFTGADFVFHLAAAHGGRGYVDTHQADTAGNFLLDGSVFKACLEKKVGKVIFASSGCVYPNYLQKDTEQEIYLREDMVKTPHDADNCFDNKTEILTDEGWKLFANLNKEEKVLTLNPNTLMADWYKPTRYIHQFYDGEMYSWRNKRINLFVTPNHRFFVKNRGGRRRFKTLSQVNIFDDKVPMSTGWRGVDNENISNDDCAFFGIYLADGCTAGNMGGTSALKNGNYDVIICSSRGIKGGDKGNVYNKIKNLLKRLEFHVTPISSGFLIRNKKLWQKMKVLGNRYTKFIPIEYKNLPQEKLRIIIEWMLLGDGSIRKGHNVYYTTSKKLADDLQEIAIKSGLNANIGWKNNGSKWKAKNGGLYEVKFYTSKTRGFIDSKGKSFIKRGQYRGSIYCVEVKNHIIMVRRNGCCCWSGNSYGWAKLMGEETLRAYYYDYGLKSVSCRYFTVYGEYGNESHAVIAMIAKAFIRQDPFEIWGDGTQIRNWTYVDDIVSGTILAAEKIDDARAINLGTTERIRVSDGAKIITDLAGYSPQMKYLIDMPTGPLNRVADNRLAQELLGWTPRYNFYAGVKKTLDWYFSSKDRARVRKIIKNSLMDNV